MAPYAPLDPAEQSGPPPLVEDFHDSDDFPEGYALPDQSPAPDFDEDEL